MDWTDSGIVVGVRSHGETSVILEALTRLHGRHTGFVHGGRSRRLRPCLQLGNSVELVWRSRVEDQLGSYTVEPERLRTARLMDSAAALHAIHHLCAMARLLAEREPHESLHGRLEALLDGLDGGLPAAADMVRLELALLSDLGFGLDLDRCAATGRRDDLVYVSPKSGRAVSREAGAPYHDRLLPLPAFLRDGGAGAKASDIDAGFGLTGFFLERDVLIPRGLGLPPARAAYIRAIIAPSDSRMPVA